MIKHTLPAFLLLVLLVAAGFGVALAATWLQLHFHRAVGF